MTRLGLGIVRHMEVIFLWAQEALRRKLAMGMKEMKDKNESVGGFSASTEVSRIMGDEWDAG